MLLRSTRFAPLPTDARGLAAAKPAINWRRRWRPPRRLARLSGERLYCAGQRVSMSAHCWSKKGLPKRPTTIGTSRTAHARQRLESGSRHGMPVPNRGNLSNRTAAPAANMQDEPSPLSAFGHLSALYAAGCKPPEPVSGPSGARVTSSSARSLCSKFTGHRYHLKTRKP